jgi:hypothetical protein
MDHPRIGKTMSYTTCKRLSRLPKVAPVWRESSHHFPKTARNGTKRRIDFNSLIDCYTLPIGGPTIVRKLAPLLSPCKNLEEAVASSNSVLCASRSAYRDCLQWASTFDFSGNDRGSITLGW